MNSAELPMTCGVTCSVLEPRLNSVAVVMLDMTPTPRAEVHQTLVMKAAQQEAAHLAHLEALALTLQPKEELLHQLRREALLHQELEAHQTPADAKLELLTLARLALQDQKDLTDTQAWTVLPDLTESQERMPKTSLQRPKTFQPASTAHKGLLDHQDPSEDQEVADTKELMVNPVCQDVTVNQDTQVSKARLDLLDAKGLKDTQARKETMDANQLVAPDRKDNADNVVNVDQLVMLDTMANKDLLDLRVRKVNQAPSALSGLPAALEKRATLDAQAKMPNTAHAHQRVPELETEETEVATVETATTSAVLKLDLESMQPTGFAILSFLLVSFSSKINSL